MEDRKLYHLVNGEFVHNGMPYNTKTQTYAEIAERIALWDAVDIIPEIPVAESVTFTGISDGKRTDAVQASLYDAMMAELSAEKYARAEKFRKTHDMRNKSKDDTPADRRKNRINRMHRLYGTMFEDGKDWYWENGKEGQKKSTEPGAEIFCNLKERIAEKVALADWKLEQDAIAEEEEWERFNAELFEFDRQWREQAKAEQERVRKAREAIEFNEWLKWA